MLDKYAFTKSLYHEMKVTQVQLVSIRYIGSYAELRPKNPIWTTIYP